MVEEKEEKGVNSEKQKKKKPEEDLDYCTTAPSPEHARAGDEDEPCDDYREGEER